ncbi:hypothetical protein CP557_11570 [Natrinema ejinorense]|uniref:Uncharacterized protein n=2 Tax=Natrinema ejinorense TaxID=373386 RepID=A0A2A5QW99_9EURY|nr:hypothetical protein CP557_11570 [Natrinema ejinorense]
MLAASDVEYFLTDETCRREYGALVFVPTGTADIEALVDELRDIWVQEGGYVTISTLENVLSINVASLGTLWVQEYRPGTGSPSKPLGVPVSAEQHRSSNDWFGDRPSTCVYSVD